MLGFQHLTAILGILRAALGKAREFAVSMALTDCAVFVTSASLFAKAIYVLVFVILKLLVWISKCAIAFLIDLPRLIPLLFTAALPVFGRRGHQKLTEGLEDMVRKRPCTVSTSIPSNMSIILRTILFWRLFEGYCMFLYWNYALLRSIDRGIGTCSFRSANLWVFSLTDLATSWSI